jgi:NADH dehydrogenase
VITGAFSYTGKYVTRLLLQRGYRVRTLTFRTSQQNQFGPRVQVFNYNFENPEQLEKSLQGASVLINTYWVRFPKGDSTFASAVKNSHTLFRAAKNAGVRRIVHVSIANPSLNSGLGYYRGKAQVEEILFASNLSYSVLRPTVIFGNEDILINNIAWFLRKFPFFAVPGDGRYRIRPIYVGDMACLLADAAQHEQDEIFNAVGPETFSFEQLVRLLALKIGKRPILVRAPEAVVRSATTLVGKMLGDVVLTREEYRGLMDCLLAPEGPATGQTRLTDWLTANAEHLGLRYSSEVALHFTRVPRDCANMILDGG